MPRRDRSHAHARVQHLTCASSHPTSAIPSRGRFNLPWIRTIAALSLAAVFFRNVQGAQPPERSPSLASNGWEAGPGYLRRPLAPAGSGAAGFQRLSGPDLGIHFTNSLSAATSATNRLLEIGSGVAAGDVDGDGRVDLYFCGLENRNALFRNLGAWQFEDRTAAAGVACEGNWSTGCALADLDGDGDLDLLVNGLGTGTRAFLNRGDGTFEERTNLGFFRTFGATSFAIADLDLDGDLDVYVTNYRADTFFDHPRGLRMEMRRRPDGTQFLEPRERFLTLPTSDGPPLIVERGEPDVLYINRGDGRFVPIKWDSAAFANADGSPLGEMPSDWGLAAAFRDLNQDGWPDLYVCNDFVHWADRLWINDAGRRFVAAPATMVRTISLASMAVDFADLNRDGFDDFIVADMLSPRRADRVRQRPDLLAGKIPWPVSDPAFRPESPRNTLQIARGDGTFAEVAQYAGLAATDWTPNLAFLDVDLDGWEDLLVATGNVHDVQDADALSAISRLPGPRDAGSAVQRQRERKLLPPRRTSLMAFRNLRDLTFESAGAQWNFDDPGFVQGMALADLDQDGDLDAILNPMNEPARLYRNQSPAPRIALRARGTRANSHGIGTRFEVKGGPVVQSQELMLGGRFASTDDAQRTFATGTASHVSVDVHWPGGRVSTYPDLAAHYLYKFEEPTPHQTPRPRPAARAWFGEASALFSHRHVDAADPEFPEYPLRHRRLGTLGPGVAWTDLDGDGRDELLIAGGREGRSVLLRRAIDGPFVEPATSHPPAHQALDHGMLLAIPADTKDRLLEVWAGILPYTAPSESSRPALERVDFADSTSSGSTIPTPGVSMNTGPLAAADVDLDGDVDLFVGSRYRTGRYPESTASMMLLRSRSGLASGQILPDLGLVSGAVFADFDQDGDPDLALACEWGPPRVLRNEHGQLVDTTVREGLAELIGWWNGIATGDFDGDGLLDLAVSNWGLNARADIGATQSSVISLHFGEFTGDGRVHGFLASPDPDRLGMFPWRERNAFLSLLPAIAARFPDHRSFANATVDDLLVGVPVLGRLHATFFESVVLLNRTSRWERVSLPREAQFAPAFGITVADFDLNGTQDLFLAQNFFGVDAESSRQDAGTGLVLSGRGNGRFTALTPALSGIFIAGEQRGAAVSDFNQDGRPDLVVGVHQGMTRGWTNQSRATGLRVRLQGPRGNPSGIGATLRLHTPRGWGPAFPVTAGSGYWSQDSATLVVTAPAPADRISVRWPGVATPHEVPIPASAREIVVSAPTAQSLPP